MGMDVIGKNPTSERGEYFRNNIWWWRPLWDYCCRVGGDFIPHAVAEGGQLNDGVGLNGDDSTRLAQILREEIERGNTAEHERQHNEYRASLPREACTVCDSTGIRTDEVGVKMGMPERELSPEAQIYTGRTHGWCNACEGIGTQEAWLAGYPFTTENVREFADFLADSGGFEVW